jgi:predicted enzyme related to lactoylglutathione lyase
MLTAAKIVAFVATVDSTKARAFYEGVLGLNFLSEDEFAIVFNAHGIVLRVQKVPTLIAQPHTQLGWSVSSIDQVVRALRERGAVFENYPFLKHDSLGIWTAPSGAKIAWLKDPGGNLLSVTEPRLD